MWKQMVSVGCLIAGLTAASPLWAEGAAEKSGADGRHRVVLHLNSGDAKVQRGLLSNIKHLYQELGREALTVELVAHGAGLSLFTKKETTLAGELARLKRDYGVHYTACSNTMKAMQVTREDLIEEVGDTVPAVVRLMERQEQGWAYIKP